MIMYAWKQFGNDFRNGDDAVFWDSNRPRDENGTKIRPWLQWDKWSFRDVNKKTDFSMYGFHGIWEITWVASWYPIPIPFKSKWKSGDAPENRLPLLQASSVNNPNYRINKETINYQTTDWIKSIETEVLEIVEDWLYQIDMSWQFIMPDSYNANNAYQYKFFAALMQPTDNWYYDMFNLTTTRWVWKQDMVKVTDTQVYKAWQKITAWYLHTWTGWVATVHGTIKAIRLW